MLIDFILASKLFGTEFMYGLINNNNFIILNMTEIWIYLMNLCSDVRHIGSHAIKSLVIRNEESEGRISQLCKNQ